MVSDIRKRISKEKKPSNRIYFKNRLYLNIRFLYVTNRRKHNSFRKTNFLHNLLYLRLRLFLLFPSMSLGSARLIVMVSRFGKDPIHFVKKIFTEKSKYMVSFDRCSVTFGINGKMVIGQDTHGYRKRYCWYARRTVETEYFDRSKCTWKFI